MREFLGPHRQPGLEQARTGIIAPKPIPLESGTRLYRFANRLTHGWDHRAGPWWIDETAFERIVARAERAGVDLASKARWDLAILPAWERSMDLLLQARVTARLWAWTGLAKPQQQTLHDRMLRMFGNRDIRQLYLIGVADLTDGVGVGDPNDRAMRAPMPTQLARQHLAIIGAKHIRGATLP
ncbi:MAG: hypothetical protein AB7O97_15580 [Planctomycetota bacterium]